MVGTVLRLPLSLLKLLH